MKNTDAILQIQPNSILDGTTTIQFMSTLNREYLLLVFSCPFFSQSEFLMTLGDCVYRPAYYPKTVAQWSLYDRRSTSREIRQPVAITVQGLGTILYMHVRIPNTNLLTR